MYKHVLSHSVMPNSLRPHGLHPTRLLCPWGFSREECWSGLPFPSPGDLPNPEVEPRSPVLEANSLPSDPPGKPIRGTQQIVTVAIVLLYPTSL